MSKNSKAKRKKLNAISPTVPKRTGYADVEIDVVREIEVDVDVAIGYVGRHRADDNACAPFTTDAYTHVATYSEPTSSSDTGSSTSSDTGSGGSCD